jgi:hypothetical protein
MAISFPQKNEESLYSSQTLAWRNSFSDHVVDCAAPGSPSNKETYEFGAVIAKIDAYIAQGKKLCLFVGRAPHESLPSDTGEAKPDEIWVSGDILNQGPAMTSDRLHVWINFNQQVGVQFLAKKFDTVVIDYSTIKGLNNNFASRFSVLLRTSESQMLFEASRGVTNPSVDTDVLIFDKESYGVTVPASDRVDAIQLKLDYMENYKCTVPASQQKADREEYMQADGNSFLESLDDDCPQEERERLLEVEFMHFFTERAGVGTSDTTSFAQLQLDAHLKTIFTHVALHKDEVYPYMNSRGMQIDDAFFVVSGPK